MKGGVQRRWLFVVLAALAVVGALAVGLALRSPDDPDGPRLEAVEEVGSAEGGSVVAATEQGRSPSAVTIDEVDLPRPGYVAVYASAEGAPGRLLGATGRLDPGRHRDLHVRLRPSVRRSTPVFVLLHEEADGDDELDTPAGDPPLTDGPGVLALAITVGPD